MYFIEERAELVSVLRLIDTVRGGAEDATALLVKREGEVVGDLSTCYDDDDRNDDDGHDNDDDDGIMTMMGW
jgi:hypothetical protein